MNKKVRLLDLDEIGRYADAVSNRAYRTFNRYLSQMEPDGEPPAAFVGGVHYLGTLLASASVTLLKRSGFFGVAQEDQRMQLLQVSSEAALGASLMETMMRTCAVAARTARSCPAADKREFEALEGEEVAFSCELPSAEHAQETALLFRRTVRYQPLIDVVDIMIGVIDADVERTAGDRVQGLALTCKLVFVYTRLIAYAKMHYGEIRLDAPVFEEAFAFALMIVALHAGAASTATGAFDAQSAARRDVCLREDPMGREACHVRR